MDAREAALIREVEKESLAAAAPPDHGWQKVIYPKRQRKAAVEPAKPAPSDPRSNGSSGNVFASVEQKAQDRRRALESAAVSGAAPAAVTVRSWSGARHAMDSDDEEDDSGAEAAAGKGGGDAGEEKKTKQKKPKKPKVTVAEAASKIDASDLAAFLVDVTGSYESQPDIQMMRFADYFARSFAAVSASQFPWTKIFKESPIAKIVDVPVCHISESVYKTSVDWISQRPTEALATFVLWTLDSIFADMASQQATVKASKKPVQQPSTKAQVAIFVVLAMTLRRKPDVLSSILPTLREDPRYQGQDKLPIIMWAIAQASHGDSVVGLYAWVHNLLPLMFGPTDTMIRSVLVRRLPFGSLRCCRFPSSVFSSDASSAATPLRSSPPSSTPPPPASIPHQQQQQQGTTTAAPVPPSHDASVSAPAGGPKAAEDLRREASTRARGGNCEDEQACVLRAALGHVMKLGWSDMALIAGARDAGISPSIIGSFPRKEAALVEFFMDECLEKMMNIIDSEELDLDNLILSERLSKLFRIRLEMQAPYISKWAEALSIQAQPMNIPTSFKQRAMLIDEIWHAAGDQTSDIDWHIKRTVLGAIYSASEVYMLTDSSPEFGDTWAFLDHRIKDAFDVQKTVQEAAYLAEAVGTGIGKSTQAFMKRFLGGI